MNVKPPHTIIHKHTRTCTQFIPAHLDSILQAVGLSPHFLHDARNVVLYELTLGHIRHHHGEIEQVKEHKPH